MTAEPAGGIAEEAGRLLAALEEWVRSGGLSDGVSAGLAGLSGGAGGLSEGLGWLGAHVGGSQECRLCPLCQLLAVARTARPELWQHLGAALGNLADAVRSAVDGTGPPAGPAGAGVQHIPVR